MSKKFEVHSRPGFRITAIAYGCLIVTEFALLGGGFAHLYSLIRRLGLNKSSKSSGVECEPFIRAIDTARLFYFWRVRCLQYAASLVCLFRLHGVPAELVFGVVQQPFAAHAWVELDGIVIAGADANQNQLQVIDRL